MTFWFAGQCPTNWTTPAGAICLLFKLPCSSSGHIWQSSGHADISRNLLGSCLSFSDQEDPCGWYPLLLFFFYPKQWRDVCNCGSYLVLLKKRLKESQIPALALLKRYTNTCIHHLPEFQLCRRINPQCNATMARYSYTCSWIHFCIQLQMVQETPFIISSLQMRKLRARDLQ